MSPKKKKALNRTERPSTAVSIFENIFLRELSLKMTEQTSRLFSSALINLWQGLRYALYPFDKLRAKACV